MSNDDGGTLGKVIMSAVIIVMMVPGLVVEPGPISEVVGVGALGVVWGFELPIGGDS